MVTFHSYLCKQESGGRGRKRRLRGRVICEEGKGEV